MKKTHTCIDLSTSIQSGTTYPFIQLNNCSIRSNSLRKAISRLKSENRVAYMGISTIGTARIPKESSFFDVKQQQKSFRIANPSEEPKNNAGKYDQKQESIKRVRSLQQYCKSQSVLQMAVQKYTVRREQKDTIALKQTMVNKLDREVVKKKTNVVQQIMQQEVMKRIPKKKKEINYELDSMFKNYNKFSQFCLGQNAIGKEVKYNGYCKIYKESQKEVIYLEETEQRKKSISDESDAYKEFVEEVDEAAIQKDVYHNNLRNPFLDDKITVKYMKKAGFLKRRATQS